MRPPDMPRPSKFTPETSRTIITGIRVGLSYDLACEAAGVSFETFRQWRLGKFPRGTDPEAKTAFLEGIERARGESALRLASIISAAAPNDWKAASWMLERRFPKDFARDASLYERLDALEALLTSDPNAPTPLRKDVA
jgi:hypothetical protein